MKKSLLRRQTIGLIGFGAFGKLAAASLAGHFDIIAHDPDWRDAAAGTAHATRVSLAEAAAAPIVVLAVPVMAMRETLLAIRSHLQPRALVIDTGSVKMKPAQAMLELLPPSVQILGTHPLFGPQSAASGLPGLKIVLCPLRSRITRQVARFLREAMKLQVIIASPEDHDRQLAVTQGLTHLVAAVLLRMEPWPEAMTTASFDLLRRAIDMVRHDSAQVLYAIEHENPYAASIRAAFFAHAATLREEFEAIAAEPQ